MHSGGLDDQGTDQGQQRSGRSVERPGQVDRHIGSTDKCRRLTGWSSRTAFEEGLERTVAWYRENEAWWRGIKGRDARAVYSS